MDFWKGWPYPVAVVVLFVIVLLRAGGTYALGRAAGAGAQRTRLARLMARRGFARVQELVARWGAPVVALSFLTVGMQTLVNLAAGLTRMPLRRYVPALVIGSIIWALLYATVGFVTFAAWRRLYAISPGRGHHRLVRAAARADGLCDLATAAPVGGLRAAGRGRRA